MADAKLFKAVTLEDGTTSYVDVTSDDIPVELIKGTKAYVEAEKAKADAVAESKKRLTRAQQAENALKALASPEDDEVKDVPAKTDDKPTTPLQTKDELYNEFKQRLIADTGVETKEEKLARETKAKDIDKLMEDNRLSPQLRLVLENSTNPTETAKIIGQSSYRFDPVEGGETKVDVNRGPVADVLAKIKTKYSKSK